MNDGDEFAVRLQVTIRLCRADDLPALEWMGLYSKDRDILRAAFARQQTGTAAMLLGISNGFPVAQVFMDFEEDTNCVEFWAVRTFYALHRLGIGRRMVTAAECLAAGRGARVARLQVDDGNDEARAFYERLGWRVVPAVAGDPGRFRMCKELQRRGTPAPFDAAFRPQPSVRRG